MVVWGLVIRSSSQQPSDANDRETDQHAPNKAKEGGRRGDDRILIADFATGS